jgi:pimeloyl-ACP methyl ester carboxylesterase
VTAAPGDITVVTDVPIVARDHGGDGPDVVLLHGGSRTLEDWRQVVPLLLEAGLRVVTIDQRGHGRSGAAGWNWRAAVDDVAAVADQLGLNRPAIVGHSLGDMVAALWASEHADCPLAVNVDGHGNPRGPEQYAGLDSAGAVAAHRAFRAYLADELGPRPDPVIADRLAALLIVSGSRPDFEAVLPEPASSAFAAYRAGVYRDLAALAAANPLVSVASLPAGHDVHHELPAELTRLVLAHLAG